MTTFTQEQISTQAAKPISQVLSEAKTPVNPLFNPDNFQHQDNQDELDLKNEQEKQKNLNLNPTPDANDRSSATAMFQGEIDALNQAYAGQRANLVTQGNDRLGSTQTINFASGAAGSNFGKANIDNQVTANNGVLDTADAKHNTDIQAVYGKINSAAVQAAKDRVAAAQSGAAANVEYLKNKVDTAKSNASSAIKAYFASGNDGSKLTTQNIADWATKLKISPDEVANIVKEQVDAAKKVTADTAKAKQEADKTAMDILKTGADINKPYEAGGYIWQYDKNTGQSKQIGVARSVAEPKDTTYTFSKGDETALIGAGETPESVKLLQDAISKYGIDTVIKDSGVSEKTRNALKTAFDL